MDPSTKIQLILLFVLNVFFTFFGTVLNVVVILSLWRSTQLRKKICYFMIMVLWFFDLLAVITNHPLQAISTVIWLTEQNHVSSTSEICEHVANQFHAFSLLALLVMNFDRYLAASYPLFHRSSMTKRRLLIILGIHFIAEVSVRVISFAIASAVFFIVAMIIFFLLVVPFYLFINVKLLTLARKMRNNTISPQSRSSATKLKHISTCLLAMICLVLFSFPFLFYTVLSVAGKSINVRLSIIWINTTVTMNSTFNCLIFYWKNEILRKEGLKMLRLLKDR